MDSHDMQVLGHADSITEYCADCGSFEEFGKSRMRVEACVFNLMQIGELAKIMLSDEVKSQIKTIPWKQLYGMRYSMGNSA